METNDRTQETRPQTKRQGKGTASTQSRREESTSSQGQGSGDDILSLSRRVGRLENSFSGIGAFAGGILEQSLSQLEERLQEYEDCIVWYASAKLKIQEQIQATKLLQQEFSEHLRKLEEE